MRDLGTGTPGPDMSLCGECRMPQGSPWINWKLQIKPNGETQTKNIRDRYNSVMRANAPSSPAPSAHRFAAAGLDRAPVRMTGSYQVAKQRTPLTGHP